MKTNEKRRPLIGKKMLAFAAVVVFGAATFGLGADCAEAGGLGISLNLGCASFNFGVGDDRPCGAPPAPIVVAEPAPFPAPLYRPHPAFAPAPRVVAVPAPVPTPAFRPAPNGPRTPIVRGQAPAVRAPNPNAFRTYSPVAKARGNAPGGPRNFEPRR